MELFSPHRPETSPGRKSLRGCLSHVPHIMVYPHDEDETLVELRIFLPVSHNNYRCHVTEIVAATLPKIFADYREDPEHALFLYFNWTAPNVASPQMASPKPRVPAVTLLDQSGLL
jgi:hypothetical protein